MPCPNVQRNIKSTACPSSGLQYRLTIQWIFIFQLRPRDTFQGLIDHEHSLLLFYSTLFAFQTTSQYTRPVLSFIYPTSSDNPFSQSRAVQGPHLIMSMNGAHGSARRYIYLQLLPILLSHPEVPTHSPMGKDFHQSLAQDVQTIWVHTTGLSIPNGILGWQAPIHSSRLFEPCFAPFFLESYVCVTRVDEAKTNSEFDPFSQLHTFLARPRLFS